VTLKPRSPQPDSSSSPLLSQSVSSSPSIQWEDAPTELTRRCTVMEIFGETDTGKTTLALTAPGPIAYIHAHEKVEGVLQQARQNGKVIRVCPFGGAFRGGPEEIQKQASAQVAILEAAFYDAFTWAKSVILDTHTEAWQLYQLAKLGTLTREGRSEKDQKLGQLVYTEINSRWNSLFKTFRVHAEAENRTNLILIGRTKDEYKKIQGKKQSTGKTISAGQKDTFSSCDVRLRTRVRRSSNDYTFSALVIKPWWNGMMRGEVFEDELMNFPQIMALIAQTDIDEWS
jgi:hypothetical protein